MPPDKFIQTKGTLLEAPCANCWLYGYSPQMKSTGPAPNGLPFLKCLANGEVKWIVFELTGLIVGLRTIANRDQNHVG